MRGDQCTMIASEDHELPRFGRKIDTLYVPTNITANFQVAADAFKKKHTCAWHVIFYTHERRCLEPREVLDEGPDRRFILHS